MSHLEGSFFLTEAHCTTLLAFARSALRAHFRHQPESDDIPDDPALHTGVGLFVTLWQRKTTALWQKGQLRGCIGHVETDLPLYFAVQQTAVEAAIQDPRFPPLSPYELDHVLIEISVLSPLIMISDLAQVEIGTHGLMLVNAKKRGLLLPQVPLTREWNREQFIYALHKKAGLPQGVWPESAQLYAFTTTMFEESPQM